MLQNYLKTALRNLWKNKITGIINIVGLAVGMAVAILIGLWMHDELTYNKNHQHYDKLAQAMLTQTFNGQTNTGTAISLPLGKTLRDNYGSDFQEIALCSWNFDHILAVDDNKIAKQGMWAEPALPKMLSLPMIHGNWEEALKTPSSILIAESIARHFFGDDNPMGKSIKVDSRREFQVTGVFKDMPHNSSFYEVLFYLPWEAYLDDQEWVKMAMTQWDNHSFQLFAQIAENSSIEAVSEKIRDVEKNNNTTTSANPQLLLHPMSKWYLYADFKDGINSGGRIQYVRLFGIIGIFVLLLACINFMNLSTARSEKRAKEVGIRKTVGSMRGQLIGQFLSESLLVVFLSMFIAVLLVQLALPWFNEVADKEVTIPWTMSAFWVLLLAFGIFTGLLAGSYPAFYLSSFQPLKVLKGMHRAGRWAALPRQSLVVLQFTVSVSLIIGTMVVFQQIQHAKNRPVGYSRDGLLQTFITNGLYGKVDALRAELLATGMVEEVSQSSSPTTGIWSNLTGFEWEGKDPAQDPLFGFVACNEEFGKTIGWELLEGRDFSREFGMDSTAFILNESAVKLTGLDDIVGKTIRWEGTPKQVIGVVRDMVMDSPYEPMRPTIFAIEYGWANIINVKLKPGVPVEDALDAVEAGYVKIDPDSPFDYKFADEEYDQKFRSEVRIGTLARLFAFLAVLISCLGLFGLSTFSAEQRTKEIGIRKVLGATVAGLWALQAKNFVLLVVVSCMIAIPLAWYFVKNWLSDYQYRIDLNWSVFVLAAGLAIVVTLLTVSFQSVRAALANPVKSLKSE
ncbi:MAG TPA: ABC transporter permease [Saprospiraceae bacterium]|nr:ABC transporter permease [Saprospiraceae bacterium]HMQ83162.1 ABC transporter permease [Saprospiraceae bacterium]